MSVFLLFGCEIAMFSLLLGSYLGSLGLGLIILGGSGLIIYPLFQRLYTLHPFLWVITFLGGLTTLLWASYIDFFFDTNFVAVFLSVFIGIVLYSANYFFAKKHYSDML
jgi:hypothetical protein